MIPYNQKALKDYLNSHPLLNIRKLEDLAGVPEGAVRHFLKGRRALTNSNFSRIENELTSYGYNSDGDVNLIN